MLNTYRYDEQNNSYEQISIDGALTNPLRTSHDATNGEIVEKKVFLRNVDNTLYYTDITLTGRPARKTRVGDPNYPEASIGFKIIVQDEQPTENQWLAAQSGESVSMSDIGDSQEADTSFKAFWIQIEISPGSRPKVVTDISLAIDAFSNPVGL
jgi:hypothetical protein